MRVGREYRFFRRERRLRMSLGVISALLLLISSPSYAQQGANEINPQITSNGGEFQQGTFGSMISTIGEAVASDSIVVSASDGDITWTGFWHVMPADTTSGVYEEWAGAGTGTSGITSAAPNPFSEEIMLYVRIASPGNVRLAAYDMLGRERQILIDGDREAGTSRVRWQPEGIEIGTYILRLEIDGTLYPTTTVQYVQ